MLEATALLFAISIQSAAVYKCPLPDGNVVFRDQPCEVTTTSISPDVDRLSKQGKKRQYQYTNLNRPNRVETAPRVEKQLPLMVPGLASLPTRNARFGSCSAAFFTCAHNNDVQMDSCVARIPACSTGASSCCDTAYVTRYQQLREAGFPKQSAVRDALLGERSNNSSAALSP